MATMLPGSEVPASISPWKALGQIGTDPIQTFRQLGSRPAIFPAYFLQMITGIVAFVLMYHYTMKLMDEQYSNMAIDPTAMSNMKIMGLVGGVLSLLGAPWIVGLVISLTALFFAQFQSGSTSFSALFGMIGYARVPLVLSNVIAAASVSGKPLNLSLSAMLAADASRPFQTLLAMFNPFSVWYYVLLGIGFATLLGKSPSGHGLCGNQLHSDHAVGSCPHEPQAAGGRSTHGLRRSTGLGKPTERRPNRCCSLGKRQAGGPRPCQCPPVKIQTLKPRPMTQEVLAPERGGE